MHTTQILPAYVQGLRSITQSIPVIPLTLEQQATVLAAAAEAIYHLTVAVGDALKQSAGVKITSN